jgi:ABC-type antimicrobial peptide transport system permease subunit
MQMAWQPIVYLAVALAPVLVLVLLSRVPIGYNLRNLVVRWRVTLLTALAFTLVVALLTFMQAFVNGLNRLTSGSAQPGNVMILSDGATDELFSNLLYTDTNNIERQPGVLTNDRGQPLCSKEVYIVVNQPIPGPPGEEERRHFVQLRGIDDAAISAQVHAVELQPGGKWFSEAGVEELPDRTQAIQAVLGEGVARALGQDRPDSDATLKQNSWLPSWLTGIMNTDRKEPLKVGDTFELGPRKWIVTGIMKSAASAYGSEVWAKRSVSGPLFGKDQITCVAVRTKDQSTAEVLADDLTKNFRPAVRAEPEAAYYSRLSETNKQFSFAILVVAGFMAIGGVFGVMNTMFAAISQRTKDIGVLRILGFARWQILISFFLETLLIALAGGLLGLAAGYFLADGRSATSIVSAGPGSGKMVILRLVVDTDTLAFGLLFTFVMGALGGLVPSVSAMRLRPLESLR